jgi:hypothetical protein
MITPSLRIKVTDFLATDYEQDVFQELMRIKQLPYFDGAHFPLYFWYDREYEHVDLSVLKDFIMYWKSSGEYGTKLSIHPEPFDDQNHFIWYDIQPYDLQEKLKEKLTIPFVQYYRFAYRYSDPKTGISEGLQDFQDKYEFVSRGNSSITTRKQKRNDYEDSDNR